MRPALLAIILSAAIPAPAHAQEAKLWLPVTILFEPEAARVRGYLELQPRFDEDLTGAEMLLIRPAVGLEVKENLTALLGYAWVPQFRADTEYEQRTWQQLSYAREDAPQEFEARARLEQRYLPQGGGTSWRFRGRLFGSFRFVGGWKWTVGNEAFATLNRTTMSAPRGLDQNRFEVGVSRTLGDRATLQPRYIAQYQKRTSDGAEHVLNHVLSIGVEVRLR